jgi:hypothetical protein
MRKAAAVLTASVSLVASPRLAWDGFGHMEVAQIAWDALAPAVRAGAAELPRLNPQYVA